MSYLKSVLQPDEQVRYVTNVHWIVYLPGVLLLLLALAAFIGSYAAQQAMAMLWIVLAAMLLVAGGLILMAAWFRRWTTEIAITNRRIIYKRGFIQRHTAEMHGKGRERRRETVEPRPRVRLWHGEGARRRHDAGGLAADRVAAAVPQSSHCVLR